MEKYKWKNIGESAVLYVQFLSEVFGEVALYAPKLAMFDHTTPGIS